MRVLTWLWAVNWPSSCREVFDTEDQAETRRAEIVKAAPQTTVVVYAMPIEAAA